MSINVNDKNLGHATAYAYYKAGGGTMTEAEFTEFMADFGTASQTAVEAAQAALASKNAAQTAATTATNKATEATTAATTATNKAAEAQADADAAALDASQAMSAASTATTKATEATTAAATAVSAKDDAVSANTAAQSAKTAAQTAQTGAETAAASVAGSAAQIQTNAEDISALYQITGQKQIEFITGYNITLAYPYETVVDLTPSQVGYYAYAIVDCSEGDLFLLNAMGGGNPRTFGFLDADNKLLKVSQESFSANNAVVIAPKGASKLVINSISEYLGECWHGYLQFNIDSIRDYIGYDLASQFMAHQIDTGGTIGSVVNWRNVGSAGSYKYYIADVTEGESFLITGTGGVNPRLWCFLDADDKILSVAIAGEVARNKLITAPTNAVRLICNVLASGNNPYSLYKADSLYLRRLRYDLDNITNDTETDIDADQTLKDTIDYELTALANGVTMAEGISAPLIDFKKSGDLMVHVTTFAIINDIVYMTYYANRTTTAEDPTKHIARMAYCSLNNPSDMVWLDLQSVGDTYNGESVTEIYDTILMRKDDGTLYLMWTAKVGGVYKRLYRTFTVANASLSDIATNNFYFGSVGGEWSTAVMESALTNVKHKTISGDIGLMQKLSSRIENGVTWYYSGAYANEFNCIVKSSDLVNWYFVATPDVPNHSQYENATYVVDDKVWYFVRQTADCNTGFLTYYDLTSNQWAKPVYIADCQSRSDFVTVGGNLYLIHAPMDRNHIGVTYINKSYPAHSRLLTIAKVNNCFYPYGLYYNNEFYLSYTQARQHIYLCKCRFESNSVDDIIAKFKELFM